MSGPARHYDVIIIGTGAGGGTLAYALAPSGKRILLLERGDYVRREKENWSSEAVNLKGRYNTKEVWRDKQGKPLHPHTNYNVGGNTKFYGAALADLVRGYRAVLYTRRASLRRAGRTGAGSDRAPGQRAVSVPRRPSRATHPAAPRRSEELGIPAVSRSAGREAG